MQAMIKAKSGIFGVKRNLLQNSNPPRRAADLKHDQAFSGSLSFILNIRRLGLGRWYSWPSS